MTLERWLTVLIFILALTPHVFRLSFPQDRFLHDDAYYYMQIARNIAEGRGSTFDGENFTNGYHPLWMGVCVAASRLTDDADRYVFIVLCLNVAFTFLLSLQLFSMFREELGLFFSGFLLCVVNWALYTSLNLISGLETPLYALLVMLVVDRMSRISWDDRLGLFILGCLLGLTFLARTSFGLFLPVLIGYMVWKRAVFDSRSILRIGLYMVIPAALLTLPYLAWNYSMTGHFQQISGLVLETFKSQLSTAGVVLKVLSTVPKSIMLRPLALNILLVPCAVLFLAVVARYRPLPAFFRDDRLYVLVCFCAILLVYYAAHFAEATRAWHYIVPWLTVQILFALFLKAAWDMVGSSAMMRSALLVLILFMSLNYLVQVPFFVVKGMKVHPYFGSKKNYSREMSKWISANLPKDARIGAFNAGYLGFHSGRRVINLDGLVNGVELYRYLTDGRGVWKYVKDKRIDYLADFFFGRPAPLDSEIGPRLKLLHRVGPTKIGPRGKRNYVDAYVWKIEQSGR